jgi:hypothetical protein
MYNRIRPTGRLYNKLGTTRIFFLSNLWLNRRGQNHLLCLSRPRFDWALEWFRVAIMYNESHFWQVFLHNKYASTDLILASVYDTTGSIINPFSSTALVILKTANDIAQAMEVDASARCIPINICHILNSQWRAQLIYRDRPVVVPEWESIHLNGIVERTLRPIPNANFLGSVSGWWPGFAINRSGLNVIGSS